MATVKMDYFTKEAHKRLFALKEAYKTEFAGNIKKVNRAAAEEWAKDYPEVFAKYLRGETEC